jgi:CBS domain-containing protein
MKVRDIMSAPAPTCLGDTDLATASDRMRRSATGMLVVLDAHGQIAGVITDRDLAVALGSRRGVRDHRVRHVMTRPVRTCQEQDDVRQALATMTSAHVRRLPVLSADGDLKGVVSIDDIILWAVRSSGVTATELTGALRRICVPRPADDELEMPRL